MVGVLDRLAIRTLVYAIAGIAIVGTMALGGIFAWNTMTEARLSHEQAQSVKRHDLASALDIALLQARRSEKDFLLRRSDEYVAKNADAVESARATLDQLESFGGSGPIAAVRSGIETYVSTFAEVVELQRTVGYDEKSGALGALRAAVHDAEKILGELDDPQLTILMLLMRRHEKDFIMRLDTKYVEDLSKRSASFETALAANNAFPETKEKVRGLMKAYVDGFQALAAASLALKENSAKLSAVYKSLEPSLEALYEESEKAYASTQVGITEAREQGHWLMISMIVGVAVLVALISFIVGRTVCGQVGRMAGALAQLAGGDIQVAVVGADRGDEIGAMARALAVFRENALALQAAEREREAQKLGAEQERKAALRNVADDLNRAVKATVDVLGMAADKIKQSAEQLAESADDTVGRLNMAGAASTEATENVRAVAAATEELSASVEEIGKQVSGSAKRAQQAVTEAEKTNTSVQSLAEAAQRIGDVVSLINDIASQTNLLALNATIEAARAGDAGKGFAVVASEVKNLANQTAQATDDIAAQVLAIQEATRKAVSEIAEIGSSIGEISEASSGIASAVDQQSAATREISSNVQSASQGVDDVSSNLVKVQGAADSTKMSAQELLGNAEVVVKQIDALMSEVDNLAKRVLAA